ncbi:MAG: DUF6504 family protein [Dehalococcoidia bacterium]
MSRLFQQAIRLEVKEGVQHKPIAFLYKGRQQRVGKILKRWRITRGWWKRAMEREYFQIETQTGAICELYRDLLTGAWYLQRIYD